MLSTTRNPRPLGVPTLNIRRKIHLAQRLGIGVERLEGVADYVDLHYNPTRPRAKKGDLTTRRIDAPRPLLKLIQRRIHSVLLAPVHLPDAIHGYRRSRSSVTATAVHAGRAFFWVADIKGFYPSITADKVVRMWRQLGCTPDVARLLTRLTTRNFRLPQGAPTSSGLANLYLVLSGTVSRLEGLATRHGLYLTFFGDDIIISSDRPFFGLQRHLQKVIGAAGFRLHPTKTGEVLGPSNRHKVLSLITNSRGREVDVPRTYRRHLKSLLRIAKRYGPEALVVRGITNKDPKAFLTGKISYAAHVNPRNEALLAELNAIRW